MKNISRKIPDKIGSVRSFLGILEEYLPSQGDNSAEYNFFYRGLTDVEHQLIPSIYRDNGWLQNEDQMIKEIIMRCPEDFQNIKTTFQRLVKKQHYSLPTRLLDLTGNPLIALFFACQIGGSEKSHGKVVLFKVPKKEIKYYDNDTVSVVSNLSKRPADFNIGKIKQSDNFSKEKQIKLLIHDIRQEKSQFEERIDYNDIESVVCVKPMHDNLRIIRQDGFFFLFGIKGNKKQNAEIPDNYKGSEIVINYKEKERILSQLESLGISYSKIFPEVQSVSKCIKVLYKSSPNTESISSFSINAKMEKQTNNFISAV